MKTYGVVLLTISLTAGFSTILPRIVCATDTLPLNLNFTPETDHQFFVTPDIPKTLPPAFVLKPPKAPTIERSQKSDRKKDKKAIKSAAGGLKDKIPFGEDLGQTWEFINGEVDILGFENLRADRRNKGLQYTTNELPALGAIDGLNMKFSAGEDIEFSFKSDVTPFIGKIDGLNFEGAAGTDGGEFSARYKIQFD